MSELSSDPFAGESSDNKRDREWTLAIAHAMNANGIIDGFTPVSPDPHALQGWLADVLLQASKPYVTQCVNREPNVECVTGSCGCINPANECDVRRSDCKVRARFKPSPFAEAIANGAVLDELEHTQPLPVVNTRGTTIDVSTTDRPLYIQMRNAYGGRHHVCVDCGCERKTGHHRFCKFHAPALE